MPSPILRSTVQAGALSTLSNVLAQAITAWRTGVSPVSLNVVELLQFVTFSVLACPPNCLWQAWLEARFPAHPDALARADEGEEGVDGRTNGLGSGKPSDDNPMRRRNIDRKATTPQAARTNQSRSSKDTSRKLNVTNTAIKFALDQTVGAVVNTVLFIAGIALLRGQSMHTALIDVKTKFWPMMLAGQKLWPAVSVLSFTVVPLEQRMLFGSVVGLFWGVYLSLAAGSINH